MKRSSLSLFACPTCHGPLEFAGDEADRIETGVLGCIHCGTTYPIRKGIPQFIDQERLAGSNRKFSRLYDVFSYFYRAFSKVAFAYIGMKEETARREVTDRLQPQGGRVLEISIGPGVNLPYLIHRLDVSEIIGLDISPGQLERCSGYLRAKGWPVDLCLGSAEELPFHDGTFEAVFHVGGINFFNDKAAAIQEMIRVAKPGARILVADETERGARAYEWSLPGFKKSMGGARKTIVAPVDLVPESMRDIRLFDIWKGWLYCIEFQKP